MEVSRNTVTGIGAVYHFVTREGQRFGLVALEGERHLVFHGTDSDRPLRTIVLAWDEADHLAGLLESGVTARSGRLGSRSG